MRQLLPLLIAIILFITAGKTLPKTIYIPVPKNLVDPVTSKPDFLPEEGIVKKVIDGDTIELSDGRKIRYIGIDTPELHHPQKGKQCFGKEAMEKNKEIVEGKKVKLTKDISETDRYGRLLRFVYVPQVATSSPIFVNDYLVKEGFAFATTFPPDVKYSNLFLESQQQARKNQKGLWKTCTIK